MTLGALRDGDWIAVSFWGAMLLFCFAGFWLLHRLVVARAR